MPSMPHVLRQAWRRIAARPSSAAFRGLLIAAGVGLVAAMFSIVDSLVMRPVPFPAADRLVQMGIGAPVPAVIEAWRRSGLFNTVEVSRAATFEYVGPGGDASWRGAFVTPGIFSLTGVRPLRGRLPTGANDREVMIAESIWRSAFAANPEVIGRYIQIDGTPVLVVGILPSGFRFPAAETVVWRTLDLQSASPGVWRITARVKDGIPREEAMGRATGLTRSVLEPGDVYAAPARSLSPGLDDRITDALWMLMGGVLLVFATLCANAGSLFLTQLSARRRDLAISSALGASGSRLLSEAAIESVIIAAAATGAGTLMAMMILALVPEALLDHSLNPIDLDRRTLAAASLVGLAAVATTGLLPAWLSSRTSVMSGIRDVAAGTESRAARGASQALLTIEIALASALLVGAGLLVRSFTALVNVERGLDAEGVIRVTLGLPSRSFTPAARAAVSATVGDAIASWSEVTAAALSQELPPGPTSIGGGQLRAEASLDPVPSDGYRIGRGFFQVYRVPIVRGRDIAPEGPAGEAVVSERLASRLWPGENPLGRAFTIGVLPGVRRVVGVARELTIPSSDPSLERPEFYTALDRDARLLHVSIRCGGRCPREDAIRERIAAIHSHIAVRKVAGAEAEYLKQLALPKALAGLASLFAATALLTAGAGLFSVLAYAASRRRREFGIRLALGASPVHIVYALSRGLLVPAAAGLAAGGAGGWIIGRAIAAYRHDIAVGDPLVWLGVVGMIVLACAAATWIPARRALRAAPAAAFREAL